MVPNEIRALLSNDHFHVVPLLSELWFNKNRAYNEFLTRTLPASEALWSTRQYKLLVLCIPLTANKISHLNLFSSTSNVSNQMTVTNLSVILLVYTAKHLLKGSFITVI